MPFERKFTMQKTVDEVVENLMWLQVVPATLAATCTLCPKIISHQTQHHGVVLDGEILYSECLLTFEQHANLRGLFLAFLHSDLFLQGTSYCNIVRMLKNELIPCLQFQTIANVEAHLVSFARHWSLLDHFDLKKIGSCIEYCRFILCSVFVPVRTRLLNVFTSRIDYSTGGKRAYYGTQLKYGEVKSGQSFFRQRYDIR